MRSSMVRTCTMNGVNSSTGNVPLAWQLAVRAAIRDRPVDARAVFGAAPEIAADASQVDAVIGIRGDISFLEQEVCQRNGRQCIGRGCLPAHRLARHRRQPGNYRQRHASSHSPVTCSHLSHPFSLRARPAGLPDDAPALNQPRRYAFGATAACRGREESVTVNAADRRGPSINPAVVTSSLWG